MLKQFHAHWLLNMTLLQTLKENYSNNEENSHSQKEGESNEDQDKEETTVESEEVAAQGINADKNF